MSARTFSAAACVAALLLSACHDQTPIPHTPTTIRIISGANQSGDISAPLDSALVVQVLDAAGKSVSGVALTWAPTNGGTVSATATTTDNDGKSSVKWTLAPTAGTQVVLVTSSQIAGASASFVASNGATLSGTVSAASTTPFATFSRSPARNVSLSSAQRVTRRQSSDRIIVGFNTDRLGVAAAASMSYRSMSTARAAVVRMRQQIDLLTQSNPISSAEISPAMG